MPVEEALSSTRSPQPTTADETARVKEIAPVRNEDDPGSVVQSRLDFEQEETEQRASFPPGCKGKKNGVSSVVLPKAASLAEDANSEDTEPVSITPPEVKQPAPKPEAATEQNDSDSVVQSWLRDIAGPVRSRRRTRGKNFGPEI